VRLQAVFYRGHDPRWAFTPLSGDGAKATGGRFNPKGVPALYLAATVETAILEMTHGFARRMEPLTIVSYDVDVDDIVDLRTPAARHAAKVRLADMACAWLDPDNRRQPASWRIANRLRKTAAGILVPSFANGARADTHHNVVLWKWGPDLPHRVTVHDPNDRLPKNQRSWQ
jgi:RES domain-containing protein